MAVVLVQWIRWNWLRAVATLAASGAASAGVVAAAGTRRRRRRRWRRGRWDRRRRLASVHCPLQVINVVNCGQSVTFQIEIQSPTRREMPGNCSKTDGKLLWFAPNSFESVQIGCETALNEGFRNCSEIALKLLWNCSEIALKLLWNCSKIVLKLLWNCSKIGLKLLWNCSETALKLLWNCSYWQ